MQRSIMPLGVYYPFVPGHLAGLPCTPAGTLASLDWKDGTPVAITSGGETVEEVSLDGSNFVDNTANQIFGVTSEPFDGDYSGAGSVPNRKQNVGVNIVAPSVGIVGNLYYDGSGGSEETIAAAFHLAPCVLRKISSGLYVFDASTATTSKATFTIVRLLDEIGTVRGRVLAIPSLGFLALGV